MKITHKIGLFVLVLGFLVSFPIFGFAQGYSSSSAYPYGFYIVPGPYSGYPIGNGGGGGGISYGGYTNQSFATGLSVACTAIPSSARVGESVLWYSSVTGGAGNYSYFWSGSDGLTGYTSSLYKSYGTGGSKSATLTVSSGTQTITVGCKQSVEIQSSTAPFPSFSNNTSFGVSCYATDDRIQPGESTVWIAVTSGGTASTTYRWDGSDGLSGMGSVLFKTYPTVGTKQAVITATTPNGQNTMAVCTNRVVVAPKAISQPAPKLPSQPKPTPAGATTAITVATSSLQGICSPSIAQAKIKKPISWQAVAIGGNGNYAFTWSGDEGLTDESTTTISKIYESAGQKRATVAITSGNEKIIVHCIPAIEVTSDTIEETGLLAASFFSYITNPLCLILAVLLAIVLGILLAYYRRRKEEEKEAPPPQIPTFKMSPEDHDEKQH